MSKFLSKKYQGLQAYVPGEQPKERKYVKLNTNESPFQPSKKAQELAKEQLQKCMLYSDPDCKELCSLLAKKLGVGTENVIVGNGSDEILNFAFMAYCGGVEININSLNGIRKQMEVVQVINLGIVIVLSKY